jgi:hypothetical protein
MRCSEESLVTDVCEHNAVLVSAKVTKLLVNLAIVGMLHKLFYYITIKPAEILK